MTLEPVHLSPARPFYIVGQIERQGCGRHVTKA
jgi:hypothetical protein